MWRRLIVLAAVAFRAQCAVIQDYNVHSFRHASVQQIIEDGDLPVKSLIQAEPRLGKPIPDARRRLWTAVCDSEQVGFECERAFDDDDDSYWQTNTITKSEGDVDPLPHFIIIDLQTIENVTGIRMTPLRGEDNPGEKGNPHRAQGTVTQHRVSVSKDNQVWDDLVAYGTWFNDTRDPKYSVFQPHQARYIRLEALSASGGVSYIRIQDIAVWAEETFTKPPEGLGKWGPTVDFPLVPVGAFVDPESHRVITFSSYAHDQWSQDQLEQQTWTSTWDLMSGVVSQRLVQNTEHDMFCPGMTYDVNGRMVLTGGTSAQKVSIFNPENDTWMRAPRMRIPRGYHGQAIASDGRIFTIGGSWAPKGSPGNRTGEIWDPSIPDSNWTTLDKLEAEKIETTSEWPSGEVGRSESYRADNHVWLFGWKNGSIFHAGPANRTHWITTTGSGAYVEAGVRGDGDFVDKDSMCGNAVMYDAAEGKILTVGGAPRYDFYPPKSIPRKGEPSSKNSFIITLDKVNATVNVRRTGNSMKHQRIFHNSIILPNGDTFVVGGMVEGQFFRENTAHTTPEIYSPSKDTWTPVASHHTVRVYHSVALLLPDATVMAGGSGLCTSCYVNHFDAQIYTPQYLLTADGKPATRPNIISVSAKKIWPGDTFTFMTDVDVFDGSLLRFGGATHALNNDQRRIALTIKKTGGKHEYRATIPADGGIAIPGPYMLFVHNENGVPSMAHTVYIQIQKE